MSVNIAKLAAIWHQEFLEAQRAEGRRLIAEADADHLVWPPEPTMEEHLAQFKVWDKEYKSRQGGLRRAESLREKNAARNREICRLYAAHHLAFPRHSREQCCREVASQLARRTGRTLSTRQIRAILKTFKLEAKEHA